MTKLTKSPGKRKKRKKKVPPLFKHLLSLGIMGAMGSLLHSMANREVIEDVECEVLEQPLLEGNNEKSSN